jgi:hypothetical protein
LFLSLQSSQEAIFGLCVILLPADRSGKDGMTLPLTIRTDLFTPNELWTQARRIRDRRAAIRMLAVAIAFSLLFQEPVPSHEPMVLDAPSAQILLDCRSDRRSSSPGP